MRIGWLRLAVPDKRAQLRNPVSFGRETRLVVPDKRASLALAMFGLYAIVSYTVSRRVGEIAIRVALGATRERIVWLVMRDASMLVGLGVTLGLGVAALVTQPLATFLVTGLSTTDPLSFAATAVAFVLISMAASWLPARHAIRVSPAIAMRLE